MFIKSLDYFLLFHTLKTILPNKRTMYNLTQNPNKPVCRQAGAISFIKMLAVIRNNENDKTNCNIKGYKCGWKTKNTNG